MAGNPDAVPLTKIFPKKGHEYLLAKARPRYRRIGLRCYQNIIPYLMNDRISHIDRFPHMVYIDDDIYIGSRV